MNSLISKSPRIALVALGAALAVALTAAAARATPGTVDTTFAVTTTVDEFGVIGSGCSLREAIQSANTDAAFGGCPAGSGDDTITLGAGSFVLSIGGPGDDTNAIGDLDVTGVLTITGQGPANTVITAGAAFTDRLMELGVNSRVVISGVRFANAHANSSTPGAVFFMRGDVVLINCDLLSNASLSASGAASIGVGAQVVFISSTIRNNSATIGGGAFITQGRLVLIDSVVSGNSASMPSTSHAGAILVNGGGSLILTRTLVTGNSAPERAGAIAQSSSIPAQIFDSTIQANSAPDSGGLLVSGGGLLMVRSAVISNTATSAAGMRITGTLATLVNTTVSGNDAQGGAGGIAVNGTAGQLNLFNTTIAANRANLGSGGNGGGINIQAGSHVTMVNSIIADNLDLGATGDSPDCFGTIFSNDYSLVENGAGCVITGATANSIFGTAVNLGPLTRNGGPTLSHMPKAGSPVIDAGNPAGCLDQKGALLSVDQRGFARTAFGESATRCDMGAVERNSYVGRVFIPIALR